jgi:hypothetical protein
MIRVICHFWQDTAYKMYTIVYKKCILTEIDMLWWRRFKIGEKVYGGWFLLGILPLVIRQISA